MASRGCSGCAGPALAAPTPRRFDGHRAWRWCMWGHQRRVSVAPPGPWGCPCAPEIDPPPKSQRAQLRGRAEVEAVTGERGVLTKGTKQYQVKWKNYSETSWEPADVFDSKSKPLQEYKKGKKAHARTAAACSDHTNSSSASVASRITDSGYMCPGRNHRYCLYTQGCHVSHTQ